MISVRTFWRSSRPFPQLVILTVCEGTYRSSKNGFASRFECAIDKSYAAQLLDPGACSAKPVHYLEEK